MPDKDGSMMNRALQVVSNTTVEFGTVSRVISLTGANATP